MFFIRMTSLVDDDNDDNDNVPKDGKKKTSTQ